MFDAASSHAIFGLLMVGMFVSLVLSGEPVRFRGQGQGWRLGLGVALAIGSLAHIAMVVGEKAPLPMWANVLSLVGCGFGLSAALVMVVGSMKART